MLTYNMTREQIESEGIKGATRISPAKILDEFYLYTDKDEKSVGHWLASTGYWESWITSWMTRNIQPGFRCLDIGANYGYYTRVMEKLSGPTGAVIAIEANPELVNSLSDSITDFPTGGAPVEIIPIAISNKKGKDTLSISTQYIGGSSLVYGKEELPSNISEQYWDIQLEVDTDTIDNLIHGHLDLIKMDIEGAEHLAWEGMQKTLENTDLLVLECGSYSPTWFLDEIFDRYEVSIIHVDGTETSFQRKDMEKLSDLVMAVLRKNP